MARKERATLLIFDVPPEVEENYVFDIWRALARSLYLARQKLAPLKIVARHYAAMAVLASLDKPATQSSLVRSMGISPNIALAMVDYLDHLGYTRRVQNPRNRRENIVLLTNKGRKAYDQAVRLLQQTEDELFAPLSMEEREQCRALTRKLTRTVPAMRYIATDVGPSIRT